MSGQPTSSRGKWVAIVLLALGVAAALAEWKVGASRRADSSPASHPAQR